MFKKLQATRQTLRDALSEVAPYDDNGKLLADIKSLIKTLRHAPPDTRTTVLCYITDCCSENYTDDINIGFSIAMNALLEVNDDDAFNEAIEEYKRYYNENKKA